MYKEGDEILFRGKPIPSSTRCEICYHPILSHMDETRPGNISCLRCACAAFTPEKVAATVSGMTTHIREEEEYRKVYGPGTLLGTSKIEKCNHCLHRVADNYYQVVTSYSKSCHFKIKSGGPCGCVVCYCNCAHSAKIHNTAGCTSPGCACDISNGAVSSLAKSYPPVLLEIDKYLSEFEVVSGT